MFEEYPGAAPFFAALRAAPEDSTIRLVFADWLEDHGDARAGWLRDEEIWSAMLPDVRDPVPVLVEAIVRADWQAARVPIATLQKLGPQATESLRDWLRRNLDRWQRLVSILTPLRPPTLRPVAELIDTLAPNHWVECWLAVIDLGHHGPAAAPAVGALVELLDRWGGDTEEEGTPLYRQICSTLAAIGPAANGAIPALLRAGQGDDGLRQYAQRTITALLPHCAGVVLAAEDWRAVLRLGLRSRNPDAVVEAAVRYRLRPALALGDLKELREVFRNPPPGVRHEVRLEVARTLAALGQDAQDMLRVLRTVLDEYELYAPGGDFAEAAQAAIRDAIRVIASHCGASL